METCADAMQTCLLEPHTTRIPSSELSMLAWALASASAPALMDFCHGMVAYLTLPDPEPITGALRLRDESFDAAPQVPANCASALAMALIDVAPSLLPSTTLAQAYPFPVAFLRLFSSLSLFACVYLLIWLSDCPIAWTNSHNSSADRSRHIFVVIPRAHALV
jgi:hypothetical protein